MASPKKILSPTELVQSHQPKNFKYCFDIHDEELLKQLLDAHFDFDTLDTIANPELMNAARNANYKWYEREVVARAKKPTVFANGVILTKKMATKADKKLQRVGLGFFTISDVQYVSVRLCYEKFDIYQLFILT